MKPLFFSTEQFSDDPADSYLQYLLSNSVEQLSTKIYFYVTKKNIRVFANSQREADISELEEPLREELSEVFEELRKIAFSGMDSIVIPKGFHEEIHIPVEYLGGLEKRFKELYCLKDLESLSKNTAYCDININGTKIRTSLEKKLEKEGYYYHMFIEYL